MEAFSQVFRLSLRSLVRSPVFLAGALGSIVLGIGANVATFGVIDAVLLRPLPFPDADRLVLVQTTTGSSVTALRWSYPRFHDLAQYNTVFGSIAAFQERTFALTDPPPSEISVEFVSPDYFHVLGTTAARGRVLDSLSSTEGVAVISDRLWHSRYNGAADAVGRRLDVNGVPLVIIGILSPGFGGQSGSADAWIPAARLPAIAADSTELSQYSWLFAIVGRIRSDLSTAQWHAAAAVMARRFADQTPVPERLKPKLQLVPLQGSKVDPRTRKQLLLILCFGIAVLVGAATNVAALLLVRTERRRREMLVRMALGAGARDIALLCFSEALILALSGGALAFVFGTWAADGIWLFRPVTAGNSWYRSLTSMAQPTLDWRIGAFAASVIVLVCSICTLLPFLQVWRGRSLRGNDAVRLLRTLGRFSRVGVQGVLAAAQIACAFVLVGTALLLATSLFRLLTVDPGFQATHVVAARVQLPKRSYDEAGAAAFYDAVLGDLRELGSVQAVGLDNTLPLSGRPFATAAEIDPARPVGNGGPGTALEFHAVSPSYFHTLGIRVVRGRGLEADDRAGSTRVVLINEAAARTFWPGTNPVGQHIHSLLFLGTVGSWNEAVVVGVVRDVAYGALGQAAKPAVYASYAQSAPQSAYILLASPLPARTLFKALKDGVARVDASVPIYDAVSLPAELRAATSAPRFTTVLVALYGGIALTLAAVGLYAVVAFGLSLRRKDIGIRAALGAQRGQILRSAAADGLVITAAGVIAGGVLAFIVFRLLSHSLYGLESGTSFALLVGAAVVGLVACVAAVVPAAQAVRVDPKTVLAAE